MNAAVNWGNLFIIFSLVISLVALGAGLAAAAGRDFFRDKTRVLYLIAAIGIGVSVLLLLYYFIASDFRFIYVYNNSSRDLALPYRIAAFWAGKEGSFLLWLLFLSLFGLFTLRSKSEHARIVTVIVLMTQVFILALLVIESPFLRVWEIYPEHFAPGLYPADGAGLNPLLRDPWMIAHPPVLFLGYASATLPFGFAISALIKKDMDGWIRDARPWLLFSTVSLGIGIFLGGYWAYTVLGWGGYWGWDPVENSSLIPWLFSVALVHGFFLQMRRNALMRTNLLMAIVYFELVFLSTWFTRGGALSNFSVHSFSSSGVADYLLAFIILTTIASIVLFIVRFGDCKGKSLVAEGFNWDMLTIYGIIVLLVYALVILAGTAMPIITGLIMEHPANVTESFYNNFTRPFGMLILLLMVAATTRIVETPKALPGRETLIALAASVTLGILINAGFTSSPAAFAFSIIGIFLSARAVIDLAKTRARLTLPSRLAHIGVGIMALGIVTSGFHTVSGHKKMIQGTKYEILGLQITFLGYQDGGEPSLRFTITDGMKTRPANIAYYFDHRTESIYKEPHIIPGLLNDLYIAPEDYVSGAESVSLLVIARGEEKQIGKTRIRFIGFRTEHMTSGKPTTYADLEVNGRRIAPGIRFTGERVHHLDGIIPGTDRSVSLREINATSKRILLYVAPDKNIAVPPDTVIITVTRKRMIWLVWLGTVMIAAGGSLAFALSLRTKGESVPPRSGR